jgi:hypothetical protein
MYKQAVKQHSKIVKTKNRISSPSREDFLLHSFVHIEKMDFLHFKVVQSKRFAHHGQIQNKIYE